jgi:hypothetical protein
MHACLCCLISFLFYQSCVVVVSQAVFDLNTVSQAVFDLNTSRNTRVGFQNKTPQTQQTCRVIG